MNDEEKLKLSFNKLAKKYLSHNKIPANVSKYDIIYARKNIEALFNDNHPILKYGVPRRTPYDVRNGWTITGINGILLDIDANEKGIKEPSYVNFTDISDNKLKNTVYGEAQPCVLQSKYRHKTSEEKLLFNSNVEALYYVSTEIIDKEKAKKIIPHEYNLKEAERSFVSEQRSIYNENVKTVGKDKLLERLKKDALLSSVPRFTSEMYNYMMCQRMEVKYTPRYSKKELLIELHNALKEKPHEITTILQKATYQANVAATVSCSKTKTYEHGNTREANYLTDEIKNVRQNELKKSYARTR